jgi:hypothetical protein
MPCSPLKYNLTTQVEDNWYLSFIQLGLLLTKSSTDLYTGSSVLREVDGQDQIHTTVQTPHPVFGGPWAFGGAIE